MAASDDDIQRLLKLYEQSGGQALPGAPPEQGFFDSIGQSMQGRGSRSAGAALDSVQEIYPTPEFVVKTTDDTGRKVFLNICSSDAVQAPGNWEGGQVPENVRANLENLEHLSGADAEQMRFPLSLSEPRNDLDKQGEPCTVFDCVFNTDIVRGAQKLRALKVFIVEMAIGWVGHKHHLNLDGRFKLPKLRYKGDTIVPQNIRRDRKALVTDITETVDEPDAAPSLPLRVAPIPAGKSFPALKPQSERAASRSRNGREDAAHAQTSSKPSASAPRKTRDDGGPCAPAERDRSAQGESAGQFGSVDVQYVGTPCTHVIVRLQLPEHRCWAPADVTVRASCDSVHINAESIGPQAVPLNVFVKAESALVQLSGRTLEVRLAYFPISELLAYMNACKPFAAGALNLASQSLLDELQ